jgi:hypothetical protein
VLGSEARDLRWASQRVCAGARNQRGHGGHQHHKALRQVQVGIQTGVCVIAGSCGVAATVTASHEHSGPQKMATTVTVTANQATVALDHRAVLCCTSEKTLVQNQTHLCCVRLRALSSRVSVSEQHDPHKRIKSMFNQEISDGRDAKNLLTITSDTNAASQPNSISESEADTEALQNQPASGPHASNSENNGVYI